MFFKDPCTDVKYIFLTEKYGHFLYYFPSVISKSYILQNSQFKLLHSLSSNFYLWHVTEIREESEGQECGTGGQSEADRLAQQVEREVSEELAKAALDETKPAHGEYGELLFILLPEL